MLATDGVASFIILNYGDIQWTTGIANQGDPHSGLGGVPAQVGYGGAWGVWGMGGGLGGYGGV